MARALKIICGLLLTSMFFFPFCFTFLPAVNTKMVLAVLGLFLCIYNLGKSHSSIIDKDIIILSIFALGVSIASLLSMTLNNTPDGTFLKYIVSMFVWLGAAYFVVKYIQAVHSGISVKLVCFYLAGVCVLQCILAIVIDSVPSVKTFVDSFLAGEGYMGKNEGRLYGLGCALDVAGIRFAAVLVIISCVFAEMGKAIQWKVETIFLLVSFVVISFIGNMIGRTTSVGMAIALLVMGVSVFSPKVIEDDERRKNIQKIVLYVVLIVVVTVSLLYNYSASWKSNIQFGFEGFYNLIENGKWEVRSNNMLKGTFILPDNMHTWLVGDGYMDTTDNDPYYTGVNWHGFYKMTDVGYSRYLFYFGILGLLAISGVMVESIAICIKYLKNYRVMLLLLLLLNFVIWLKVSTDIFPVFAILICTAKQVSEIQNNKISV